MLVRWWCGGCYLMLNFLLLVFILCGVLASDLWFGFGFYVWLAWCLLVWPDLVTWLHLLLWVVLRLGFPVVCWFRG